MSGKQGSGTRSGSKRARGVQASPAKLRAAQLAAGIKSQTEVARRIQDAEGLDKLPRTMVNRVFRGGSVDPVSIERVARALDTDAWALYLTSKEADSAEYSAHRDTEPEKLQLSADSEQTGANQSISLTSFSMFWLWSGLALILLILFLLNVIQADDSKESDMLTSGPVSLIPVSILIRASNAGVEPLVESMQTALADDFSVAALKPQQPSASAMAVDLAREYQADAVVTLDAQRHGRYQRLRAMAFYNGSERVFWYKVVGHTVVSQQAQLLAGQISNRLRELIHTGAAAQMLTDSRIRAWDNYLQARQLMDAHKLESWVESDKTLNLLYTALKDYPDFAEGEAALCETFVWYSYEGYEKDRLQQAEKHCQRATMLAPENSYVMASQALFERRTLGPVAGVEAYQRVLRLWPDNLDALQGLGASYLLSFNEASSEIENVSGLAEQTLRKVLQIEPEYWFNHYRMASHYFYQGRMDESLAYFQQAADLGKKAVAYSGAGVVAVCLDNLKQGREAFEQLQALHPKNHLADEQLGLIAYLQADYALSLQHRLSAIEKMGDPDQIVYHQVWGALAASYLGVDDKSGARRALHKALRVIQRDKLRNSQSIWGEIGEIYYRVKLNRIAGQDITVSDHERQRLLHLASQELQPAAVTTLALTFDELGEEQVSDTLWQKAIDLCPVYQRLKLALN
ncbi:tetratricopeptide repeat protein [Lacimicrobium alkaliphilum]|uniref:Uncharacterized protein n=1 Tax=Lacimicrobium alkaliphilum TaxID=1526571 RepID=A0A0U3B3G0_9ALTE|nr:hypothetical protein [Lacimicrobium alkaliphilum]ALS98089.1 hypothetical protein AT746_07300 [Lacimicrobium alkaliphilum]